MRALRRAPKKQIWNQFLLVVKATALKEQISQFYPQIQRTDASDHIMSVTGLHRCRSTEVNQTLHDFWPSDGLVHHHIHFRGLLPCHGILPDAKFTLPPTLACSYIDIFTACTRVVGVSKTPAWYLHATARPSRSTLGGRTVEFVDMCTRKMSCAQIFANLQTKVR